nr:putative ribonuclease H-like domain-containing protein [Tanacetum cinerariifolium]
MEDVFNQGRMINEDEGIELVKDADIAEIEGRHAAEQAKKQAEIYNLDLDHPSKVLSMQEDDSEVQEVVEVVTTAKLITDVVTAASQVSAASATISAAKPSIPAAAPTVVAAYTRRRKGVIIRDLEEELSSKTLAETPGLKDKGKGILIKSPKPMKKKDQIELDAEYARKLHEKINKDAEEINKDMDWYAAIDHVKQQSVGNQYIKRYHEMKKKPQTESEARKNMMTYLKNIADYKIDFFKGMSYDEIRPIFQARFDANMRFLFKTREEMEEEDQEIIKSINETPAQKASKRRKLNEEAQEVEDLKKQLEIVNDEDDDVFTEEDLEDLWRIVKERFSTSKPRNFSDDYLLATLKTMFKKPDRQDAMWRNRNTVYGQALLLELILSKRSKKNTKCVNAADEELTAAKHKLKLKLFKDIAAAADINTNNFSAADPSNTTVSPTLGKSSYVDPSQYHDDPNMPVLEDITYTDDEEDVGAEADFSNFETTITTIVATSTTEAEYVAAASCCCQVLWIQNQLLDYGPIPTTRVHKDHLVTQIIGDLSSATQTRSMTRMVKDQGGLTQLNNEDFYTCMFACFISQEEPQRMDVKSAFLYGTIEKEEYVRQPPGFEDPDYPNKVYKVVKALYGLHQAHRAWYKTLANYLLENSFHRGKIDQTLFIKKQKGDILLV